MKNITNPIYYELKKLKLISDKNLIKIHNKTRDKKISVFKDKKSEVIFLEKYVTNTNYYSSLEYKKNNKTNTKKDLREFEEIKVTNGKASSKYIKTAIIDDDLRRKNQFNKILHNKDVLDFGCGWGGFLRILNKTKSLNGVELRSECINHIKSNLKKINISNDINSIKKKFDVITLFHVLEHFPDQVETLKMLNSKIKKNGKIIIEVPHAKDFLILQDDLKEFKDFTFWSEHLILHTEVSLKKMLSQAGYRKIKITYHQRYNLFNHLGWFLKRKPGLHKFYENLFSNELNNLYTNDLIKAKQSDTLIAIAEK